MNQIYKLVYSKALNQLVVVSENAKRASASTGSSIAKLDTEATEESSIKNLVFTLNKLVIGATLLMGLPAITTVASANTNPSAQSGSSTANTATKLIEVDHEANTQLNVTDHNGVAVININDANGNGVSDNRFSKFSTDKGAVFNNFKGSADAAFVDSKVLGEKLAANPNLKREAEVILAQVTGNDKSVIKGALEVIGKKADLVIINPNGIDLNGSKLINVKDFTASTAEVNSHTADDLKLNVNRGEINVNGDLTTDDVNTISLIAKAIQVKAHIAPSEEYKAQASNQGHEAAVKLVAGSSEFNLKDKAVKALDQVEKAVKDTRVAISGAALGSMYGSKVSFEVTDSGAGIQFDGVVMGSDNIKINSKGEVTLNKVISAKDLSIDTEAGVNLGQAQNDLIKAANIDIHANHVTTGGNASVYGVNSLSMHATDGITAGNSLLAGNTVTLDAPHFSADAGLKLTAQAFNLKSTNADFSGKVVANAATVNAQTLNASGLDFKANSASFTGDNLNLQNSNAQVGDLTINTAHAELSNSHITSDILTTGYHGADSLVKDDASTIKTTDLAVSALDSSNHLAKFTSAKDFKDVDAFVAKFQKAKAALAVDSVDLDKNQQTNVYNLDKVNVKNDFSNAGVFSAFNEKDHSQNLAVTAGGNFKNTGMLITDNMAIKAGKAIDLTGATYTYQDLNLVSPEVHQGAGIVNVGKNLNALTDHYQVQAETIGNAGTEVNEDTTALHTYITDKLTKYDTWILYHNVSANTNDIKIKGGTINAGGDININKLQGTDLAKGTDSEFKTAEQAAKEVRFDNTDGIIHADKDINIDGNVNNYATGTRTTVLDILSGSGPVEVKTTPYSLFGTGMAYEKTTSFNSMKEFLDAAFFLDDQGNVKGEYDGNKFMSAKYHLDKDNLLNTLKQVDNPQMNKYLSAIFGADWKSQNWDSLRKVYQYELQQNDNNRAGVVAFNPGAKITAGGSYHQTNGNLNLGSDDSNLISNSTANAVGSSFRSGYETSKNADIIKKQTVNTTIANVNDIRDYIEDSVNSSIESYEAKTGQKALNTTIDVARWDMLHQIANHYTATDDDVAQVLKVRLQLEQNLNVPDSAINMMVQAAKEGFTNIKASKSLVQNADGSYDYQINAYNFKGQKVLVDSGKYNIADLGDGAAAEKLKDFSDLPTKAQDEFNDSSVKDSNRDAAAVISTAKSIAIENAGHVNSQYSSLDTEVAKIQAEQVNLRGHGTTESLHAKNTTIDASDLSIEGLVSTGNTNIKADSATFDAAKSYNDKGDLVNNGGMSASSIQMDIENDLKAKGFKFAATKDVNVNVGGDMDLGSTYDVASRYKLEQLKVADGQIQTSEASKNVAGSGIKTTDGNLKVNVGGDLSMESSHLQSGHDTTVKVGGDLNNSAQQDEYHSEIKERKWDVDVHAEGTMASMHGEAHAHPVNTAETVPTETKGTKYTGSSSAAGTDAVSAGIDITYKDSVDTAHSLTTKNNKLDGQNLKVEVAGNADISNTDINVDAERAARVHNVQNPDQPEQHASASIKADSITQENQKVDTRETTHTESGFKASFGVGVSGSAVDVASHIGSAMQAGKNGDKIDPAMGTLQAIGDVSGVLGRDVISANVHTGLNVGTKGGSSHTEKDSGSTMAGNISMDSQSDIHLKNVDGSAVKDLDLNAKGDVTLERGVAKTESRSEDHTVGVGLDASVGVGIAHGVSTGTSTHINYAGNKETSSAEISQNTKFDNADHVHIKSGGDTTLDGATINAKSADVEAGGKLNIVTHQDKETHTKDSWNAGVTTGIAYNGVIAPSSTSIGGGYNKATKDSLTTGDSSGITASDNLNVKAHEIDMTGGILATTERGASMNIDADEIHAKELHDKVTEESAGFNLNVGHSTSSTVRADIGINRGPHGTLEAIHHSTIAGDNLDTAKVDSKVTEGTLNHDLDKHHEVTKDEHYQGTSAGISLDAKVVDAAERIMGGVANIVSPVSGYDNAGSSSDDAAISNIHDTKSQIAQTGANTKDSTTGEQYRSANANEALGTRTHISTGGVNVSGNDDDASVSVDLASGSTPNDQATSNINHGLDVSLPDFDGAVSAPTASQPTDSAPVAHDQPQDGYINLSSGHADNTAANTPVIDGQQSAEHQTPADTTSSTHVADSSVQDTPADLVHQVNRPADKVIEDTTNLGKLDSSVFAPSSPNTDSTGVTGGLDATTGGNSTGHTTAGATTGMNTDSSTANTSSASGAHSGSGSNTHNVDAAHVSSTGNGTVGTDSVTLSSDAKHQIDKDIANLSNSHIDGGVTHTQNPGSTSGAYGRVDEGIGSDSGLVSGNGGRVTGAASAADHTASIDSTNIDGDQIADAGSSSGSDKSTVTTVAKGDQTATATGSGNGGDDSTVYVPADGTGTTDGEALNFSDQSTAVVYSSGDLTCYVLTPKAKAASKLPGANPRTTIFSAYSKGIQELVGNDGVLCVSNVEKKVDTQYNVLKGANDIPIIVTSTIHTPTAVDTASTPVQATVISKTKVERVIVKSNTTTAQTRVIRRQVADISVSEIQRVRSALRAKGIDASKVLFLGSKTSSTSGISSLINTMNTNIKARSSELKY